MRLVPFDGGKLSVLADKRLGEPVGVVDEGESEAALDAQHTERGLVVGIVKDFKYLVVGVNAGLDAAAHAAVWAGCGHRSDRRWIHRPLAVMAPVGHEARQEPQVVQTDSIEGLVHEGSDAGLGPGPENVNRTDELVSVLAGLGTATTHDAGVHSDLEYGVRGVNDLALASVPAGSVYAVVTGGDGKLAVVRRTQCRRWGGTWPS